MNMEETRHQDTNICRHSPGTLSRPPLRGQTCFSVLKALLTRNCGCACARARTHTHSGHAQLQTLKLKKTSHPPTQLPSGGHPGPSPRACPPPAAPPWAPSPHRQPSSAHRIPGSSRAVFQETFSAVNLHMCPQRTHQASGGVAPSPLNGALGSSPNHAMIFRSNNSLPGRPYPQRTPQVC